ncbi:GNAT family N-acetyltransferase [Acuticoccus sp. MNP-M23]|uniref:GNAT family N-acetyltransferase n=1 Tax=Acuticoccus sp. MNP-M23 TaxID=3072793 RepID=UPI0028157874|nr:GNAT family N-acetyltransferase [Acuticoccus sp. MNP-M23]WMS43384.1 GNAT family N-acetyltransferase [Acuticoccus sp. MNP-M23]
MIGWLAAPRTIDALRPSDYDTLEEIHAESFLAPWSADEQAALNEGPGVTTFVARRGAATASRKPIGFITVRQAADEAEVLTMAVHPRQRGAGVGNMLLEAALRHLYTERAVDIFLEVDPSNAPALAIYRRAGFEPVGERKAYYASADDQPRHKALTMRLTLKQPALALR